MVEPQCAAVKPPRARHLLAGLPQALRLLLSEADGTVRLALAAALALVIAGGLVTALAPLALKGLVDALTGGGAALQSAWALGAAYLLALAIGRVLTEVRPLLVGGAEQRLYARLSRRFFAHLLDLPFGFHMERRTGALVQSLSQATLGCQLLIASLVNAVVPVLVEVATVLVVLAHLGQPALVATLAISAAAYLGIFAIGTARLKPHARAVSEASLDLHATLADSLFNVETLKCFTAEPQARDRFAGCATALEARWHRWHRQRAKLGLAITCAFVLSVASALAIAARGVIEGTLSMGGFVLASVYTLQMVRPLEMLGGAARDACQALEHMRPLLDVLHVSTESERPADHCPPSTCPPGRPGTPTPTDLGTAALACTQTPSARPRGLSLRGVRLSHGTREVLSGIDLNIEPGRTLAIVGASGSGKSSIARLLLRLFEPRSGCILLDGVRIDLMPVDELRARIAVVPQDIVLLNDSIAANIAIGLPTATPLQIETAARLAQAHDFITALPAGYASRVGERGLKLSGGERQRIGIARALLKPAGICLFDEATAMLDARTEAAVLRGIHVPNGLQGTEQFGHARTLIFIAHRLGTVQQAHEIVVLEAGCIVERGTHAQLLAKAGRYAAMWRAQSGGIAGQATALAVPG